MADQAARLAYAHGSAFTTEPLEAYAREVGRHLPVDDPAIYPVSGGSEAIETALKLARAYHLARGEADRWIVYRPLGELPRQHPRRPRPVRPQAAAPAVRGLARALPARLGRLPVPGRPARRATRWATAEELAAELDRAFEAAGPGHGRRLRRRADRRGDAGGGRPAGRLLAGHRRGLPAARRAAHRRRGHDRVRADRALVRARPLGRPAGHPRRGQGRDVGLLAVRVRGRVGRGPRGRRRAPAGSSTGSPTRTAGRGRRRARGPAHPRDRDRSSRRARRRASGCARSLAARARRRTRRSARSAAAACWSASSSSPTARPATPFPRAARVTEAVVRGRARAGRAASTRGRATPTASTATRSCSGRRSSSPTTSSTDRDGPRRGRSRRRRRGARRLSRPPGRAGPAAAGLRLNAPESPGRPAQHEEPRRARRARSAASRPPNDALAMLTPPTSASRPPNQSCQPQPPPDAGADDRDEQEGDPEAEGAQAVRLDAGRVEQPGHGERGDDRPGVERAGPPVDRPLDEEREPDREDDDGAEPPRTPGYTCWRAAARRRPAGRCRSTGRPGRRASSGPHSQW